MYLEKKRIDAKARSTPVLKTSGDRGPRRNLAGVGDTHKISENRTPSCLQACAENHLAISLNCSGCTGSVYSCGDDHDKSQYGDEFINIFYTLRTVYL